MEKMALCIDASSLTTGVPLPLWKAYLKPRSIVDDEKNVDPSVLQLLPYVTFLRICYEDMSKIDMEVLSYVRSPGGGESRLHDLLSVGFGGHVDRLPNEEETLFDLLVKEAVREVKEELNLDMPFSLFKAFAESCILCNEYRIYDPSTEVGSVHLGLPIFVDVAQFPSNIDSELVGADGECLDVKWVRMSSITPEVLETYEPWSKMALSHLEGVLATTQEIVNGQEDTSQVEQLQTQE